MRGRLAIVLLVALGSTVTGGAASAKPSSERCNAHRAYRKTAQLLVFATKTHQTDQVGNLLTIYYACARPNGLPTEVARDSSPGGPEYPPDDALQELPVTGDYAGSLVTVGEGSYSACHKFDPVCPPAKERITLVQARGRSQASFTTPLGAKSLTLSPAGAAAWLVPASSGSGQQLMASRLRRQGKRLRLTPQRLDSGAITHLKFSGPTLTWLNNGTPHSATLK
ncbi:MAG TPA: hypothetical protein VGY32_03640 [Solirubrobacteraceae bacterium]|nr:hypothetical protein [Solirubrobacteraceae bacterium]